MGKKTFYFSVCIFVLLAGAIVVEKINYRKQAGNFEKFLDTDITNIIVLYNNREIIPKKENANLVRVFCAFINESKKSQDDLRRGEAKNNIRLKLINDAFDYYEIVVSYAEEKDIVRITFYDKTNNCFQQCYYKNSIFNEFKLSLNNVISIYSNES